jgi:hypothetical protein
MQAAEPALPNRGAALDRPATPRAAGRSTALTAEVFKRALVGQCSSPTAEPPDHCVGGLAASPQSAARRHLSKHPDTESASLGGPGEIAALIELHHSRGALLYLKQTGQRHHSRQHLCVPMQLRQPDPA